MLPLKSLFSTSKNLSVSAFIYLLRNRRMFIVQELGLYLTIIGFNFLQVASSLYNGNFLGILGGVVSLLIFGSLAGIKIKRISENAKTIFGKIGLKREDKTANENMAKDLEVFEFLFSKKYNKQLRLRIGDN